MKATNSKDGLPRFNISIKHRIGVDDMIDGIGWKLTRDGGFLIDEPNKAMGVESALKAFKSRKAILDVTIESIRHEGDAVWVWSDNVSADINREIREQARVLIFHKFPELRIGTPALNNSQDEVAK